MMIMLVVFVVLILMVLLFLAYYVKGIALVSKTENRKIEKLEISNLQEPSLERLSKLVVNSNEICSLQMRDEDLKLEKEDEQAPDDPLTSENKNEKCIFPISLCPLSCGQENSSEGDENLSEMETGGGSTSQTAESNSTTFGEKRHLPDNHLEVVMPSHDSPLRTTASPESSPKSTSSCVSSEILSSSLISNVPSSSGAEDPFPLFRPCSFPLEFSVSSYTPPHFHFTRRTPELVPRLMSEEFELLSRSIQKRKSDIQDLLKRIQSAKRRHRRFSEHLQQVQREHHISY